MPILQKKYLELLNAIPTRNKKLIKAILREGLNPNDNYGLEGEPALFAAIRTGDPDIVNLLLDYDADPSIIYQRMSGHKLALMLNHGDIVEILPVVRPQDWLLIRLKIMGVVVPPQGVCFALSYLSMLLPEELLANALDELRKIPLAKIKKTFNRIENIYLQMIQEVKHAIPSNDQAVIDALKHHQVSPGLINELDKKSLHELLNKILTNTLFNQLDRQTYYLLHAFWVFQAIELLSVPEVHKSIFQKEAWYKLSSWLSFKQEKYIHQSVNLLLPLSLVYAGGLRCIAHYSGIYHESELQEIFNKLQTLVNQHPLKHFLSLIIKGNQHALHYKFMSHKPAVLSDINRYPVFLSKIEDPHSFSEHLFSANNITTFSSLIYVTGDDNQQGLQIVKRWQASSTWRNLHALSKDRIALRTSNFESWYNNADSGGEIEVYRHLEKNNKETRFISIILNLALTYFLGSLLLANSKNSMAVGMSITVSILFYIAFKRFYASCSETVPNYIASDIKHFNHVQQQLSKQTKVIKVSSHPNIFFQLPTTREEQTSRLKLSK